MIDKHHFKLGELPMPSRKERKGDKMRSAHHRRSQTIRRAKEIPVKVSKLARLGLRWSALAVGRVSPDGSLDPPGKDQAATRPVSPGRNEVNGGLRRRCWYHRPQFERLQTGGAIEWKGRPGSGNQSAILFGDPSKPGLYVQLLKRGPNNWSQPHSHPNDRFITVLAGTMWIGTGAKFDPENTVPLKPGS